MSMFSIMLPANRGTMIDRFWPLLADPGSKGALDPRCFLWLGNGNSLAQTPTFKLATPGRVTMGNSLDENGGTRHSPLPQGGGPPPSLGTDNPPRSQSLTDTDKATLSLSGS
jgi:hypothetical protein